ncbi:MAG: arsenate reductase ArsC [Epsilonproteobacteria bacterium]|nr:low molecular weight phosphatase family protein [Campylobacterota bacterium]NPA56744.1 arsenate reductase ArsC [Campylobacterota bacterium]
MKRVLVLCSGNSCRSIIAEALIDRELEGVEGASAGSAPLGRVNPHAQRLLEELGIWSEKYYSKGIHEILHTEFDLVVTVCDGARESCPTFPRPVKRLHIPFPDPDGKEYGAFKEVAQRMRERLLPAIVEALDSQ